MPPPPEASRYETSLLFVSPAVEFAAAAAADADDGDDDVPCC